MADLTGRMIGAMQADVKTFTEIEADTSAMGQAITVIAIAGVASLIGNIFRAGVTAGVLGMIASLVGYALFSFLVFLIGTKLMPEPTTKVDFNEAFRVIGFAASPGVFNVLAIIPILGVLISFVVGIWSLVIAVVAVREVLDYSNTGRAIIVCLIAAVICWIVIVVVMLPLVAGAFLARAAVGGYGREAAEHVDGRARGGEPRRAPGVQPGETIGGLPWNDQGCAATCPEACRSRSRFTSS